MTLSSKILIREIEETFENKKVFTRVDLIDLYKRYEPEIKDSTVAWRIFELKQKQIIRDVGKGLYELVQGKKAFQPAIEAKHKALYTKVIQQFDQVSFCLWSTSWLNEFSVHQSGKPLLILETDPFVKESVFYFVKEELNKNIFLDPSRDTFDLYVVGARDPILLTKLITKAPIQSVNGVNISRLEKILVDVFVAPDYFPAFQGHELAYIFHRAYTNYMINFSTIFHYARRRGAEENLKEFLRKTDIPQNVIDL